MAKTFTRKQLLNHLIGNCDCGAETGYTKADLPTLNKLSDEQLEIIANVEGDDDEDDEPEDEDDEEEELDDTDDEEDDKPTGNMGKSCGSKGKGKMKKKGKKYDDEEEMTDNLSLDDWMKRAPVEVQQVVANAIGIEKQRRDQMVAAITANANNTFTEEQLNKMDITTLTGLAQLAGRGNAASNVIANYFGAQGVAAPVANAKADTEPLVPPTLNYAELAKKD